MQFAHFSSRPPYKQFWWTVAEDVLKVINRWNKKFHLQSSSISLKSETIIEDFKYKEKKFSHRFYKHILAMMLFTYIVSNKHPYLPLFVYFLNHIVTLAKLHGNIFNIGKKKKKKKHFNEHFLGFYFI